MLRSLLSLRPVSPSRCPPFAQRSVSLSILGASVRRSTTFPERVIAEPTRTGVAVTEAGSGSNGSSSHASAKAAGGGEFPLRCLALPLRFLALSGSLLAGQGTASLRQDPL